MMLLGLRLRLRLRLRLLSFYSQKSLPPCANLRVWTVALWMRASVSLRGPEIFQGIYKGTRTKSGVTSSLAPELMGPRTFGTTNGPGSILWLAQR